MMNKRGALRTGLALALACLPASCASVPKEVVELSYRMGGDLSAVHDSYRRLIHGYFEGFRAQRLDYLSREWAPLFIGTFVRDGRLEEVAKGVVVWSPEQRKFVNPTAGHEQEQLLQTVRFWANSAVKQLEVKRDSLLAPLDRQEDSLSMAVDESFDRLYRGNATITAHLNSLRKVQEVQDDALAALNIKDLRDKINQALIDASVSAEKGLDDVRRVDNIVKKGEEIIEK
jgi:hypothetical protein